MKSMFVESLRRLYKEGRLTIGQVRELLGSKKLTEADYKYVIGEIE